MTLDVDMIDSSALAGPPPPFPSISILQLVKESQEKHGVRHGDYGRYRSYCSAKLRRVRSALKATNAHKCLRGKKAKYTKKTIGFDDFHDPRYLQISLFEVERRWAKAMNAKRVIEDDPISRQRHSMRNSLKKAVQHLEALETLIKASPRCDASTKLNCQGYCVWLKGIVAFELREWETAAEHLSPASLIYGRLAESTPSSVLASLYTNKAREIQRLLRLCAFNAADAPMMSSMGELMKMKEELGGDCEAIDRLISEMRLKATTGDQIPIEWKGVTVPAGDEKVRALVVAWSQTDKELKECAEPREKMALLEKQIGDTRDVIEKLEEEQKRKAAEGTTGLDSSEAVRLRGYLEYIRLTRTVERYLAIIENTKQEKKHKPQDLLRLYDSVIEILKEVTEVDGADNKELQEGCAMRIEYYKTFRCYFMACAYSSLGRFPEAAALFERAIERLARVEKEMNRGEGNPFVPENTSSLSSLRSEIDLSLVTSKAERLAAVARGMEEGAEKKAEEIDERPLCDTLDEWRAWPQLAAAIVPAAGAAAVGGGAKGKKKAEGAPSLIPILPLPPALLPMPVKPMFFDLAVFHIRMQSDALAERMAALEKDSSTPSKSSGKRGGAAAAAASAATPTQEEGLTDTLKGWIWGSK